MNHCAARLLCALTLVFMGGCSGSEPDRAPDPVPVIAEPLQFLPRNTETELVGSARASTSAELFPETGGRVTGVMFSAGDYVRKGEPLVQLDARRERLAVDAAEVQLREADQLLGRYRRIEDTGAISESQIEAGETALASARVALQQARTELADRTIRAPFSGHIGLTEIDVGNRVNDSTPIAQLDQRSTMFVDFSAPETVFSSLRPGETVQLVPFAQPDREVQATIVATDSRVSQDSRDFIVRAKLANPGDSLRPGMSFRVTVDRRGDPSPAVPEEAIVWGGEGSHLFVVREGKASRVPVTITARRDGRAFVDGRLTRGDRVIVEGVQKVRDGQEIRLVTPAGAPASKATLRPAEAGNGE
ncbi:efflux transporter periplasmic adaptor subunit [Croceicoccus marinus]|uniref:Efflux transporter periplasmic adaptor subunit n=2 Tax=Croceicoccus marinus TaxID=450378 RepID=A0A1Z1FF47_9SPHN|nr:efflux transporter periplasmic adaptor subunit [Croceicoccus marinus]